MDKQIIGIFRITLILVLVYYFKLPVMDPDEIKFYVSDLIHDGHNSEQRNSTSVSIIMFFILGIMSFYIFQTLFYIFIGGALQNRNTSIFNFVRHMYKAFKEIRSDKYFWTNSEQLSDTSRIDELLTYRDNKMAFMTNKQASKLLKKTSHVDAMKNNPELTQSQKTLSYINNKIAFMDNKSALEWIQND